MMSVLAVSAICIMYFIIGVLILAFVKIANSISDKVTINLNSI